MKILGLAGYSGAGKTALANLLQDRLTKTKVVSFADPLRCVVAILEGIPASNLTSQKVKERPSRLRPNTTVRDTLKVVGTECLRNNLSQDLWMDLMRYRLRELTDLNCVIIPDVRFNNELALINELGGACAWLDREGCVGGDHQSSLDISGDCTKILFNNADLESLGAEALNVIYGALHV